MYVYSNAVHKLMHTNSQTWCGPCRDREDGALVKQLCRFITRKQEDGQMDGWKDGSMEGQNKNKNKRIKKKGEGWKDRRTNR